MSSKKAIALFSSAGIGELGIKAKGIEILVSNELLQDRHALYKKNYPETHTIIGDIWEKSDEVIEYYRNSYPDEELFLLYATPPCQGMSTNGMGRLAHEIEMGNRQPIDERNRLIIPTIEIALELKPRWILLENVSGMQYTVIEDEAGKPIKILDYIKLKLGEEYMGKAEVINCNEYGVPQSRKRIFTIYTRDTLGKKYFNSNLLTFFPPHSKFPVNPTLRDAIGALPPLDASEGRNEAIDFHPLHFVPILKREKYEWVRHTREGDTAYNNQCVNLSCQYSKNELHIDKKVNGKWRSNKDTPIYCEKCGALLPRPSMIDKKTGVRRLIKGFHSAYRRMKWDEPARTLTRNFIYEASDNKIHPSQNRVLSLYESLIIQSIDEYQYDFTLGGKQISNDLFSDIIGESVPPRMIELIVTMMINNSEASV